MLLPEKSCSFLHFSMQTGILEYRMDTEHIPLSRRLSHGSPWSEKMFQFSHHISWKNCCLPVPLSKTHANEKRKGFRGERNLSTFSQWQILGGGFHTKIFPLTERDRSWRHVLTPLRIHSLQQKLSELPAIILPLPTHLTLGALVSTNSSLVSILHHLRGTGLACASSLCTLALNHNLCTLCHSTLQWSWIWADLVKYCIFYLW